MDTIFAVSSGVGRAAIAIIRVSGPASADAAHALCGRLLKPRAPTLAVLRDPTSGELLDQALCLSFQAPHSFTGEDCLEFHVHGGRAVVQGVMSALGSMDGLRPAEPGEFTRRAFNNGKLDLNSAEGLADLIQADTALQRKQALSALGGGLSQTVGGWREKLIEAQSLMEAWLEFPEEDEIGDDIVTAAADILVSLNRSLESTSGTIGKSEILRDGYRVLIAGPPNAGKSSLLNRIVEREAAIVSDTPGTTRDVIEIKLDYDGIPLILFDGAGVRTAIDPIEQIGIDRVRQLAETAQLILWVNAVDDKASALPDWAEHSAAEVLTVRSKIDLTNGSKSVLGTSAVTGDGVSDLLDEVALRARIALGSAENGAVLRQRHVAAISAMTKDIDRAVAHLKDRVVELAIEDCRSAVGQLARIGGGTASDDVLDAVFSRFCIGK